MREEQVREAAEDQQAARAPNAVAPTATAADQIRFIQRHAGNAAVGRVLARFVKP